jgi:hypothetical protein
VLVPDAQEMQKNVITSFRRTKRVRFPVYHRETGVRALKEAARSYLTVTTSSRYCGCGRQAKSSFSSVDTSAYAPLSFRGGFSVEESVSPNSIGSMPVDASRHSFYKKMTAA